MLFLVFRWPNGFLPKLGRRIAKWHLHRNDYLERMTVNNSNEIFEFKVLIFRKFGLIKSFIRTVSSKELRKKLTPNFTFGCKRVLASNEFLPCFEKPHCHLETAKIKSFHENGLRTEEKSYDFDVIIYATGFVINSYDYLLPFNKSLENWEKTGNVNLYYGTLHSELPNFAIFFGPMTFLGHNSIIFMMGKLRFETYFG